MSKPQQLATTIPSLTSQEKADYENLIHEIHADPPDAHTVPSIAAPIDTLQTTSAPLPLPTQYMPLYNALCQATSSPTQITTATQPFQQLGTMMETLYASIKAQSIRLNVSKVMDYLLKLQNELLDTLKRNSRNQRTYTKTPDNQSIWLCHQVIENELIPTLERYQQNLFITLPSPPELPTVAQVTTLKSQHTQKINSLHPTKAKNSSTPSRKRKKAAAS